MNWELLFESPLFVFIGGGLTFLTILFAFYNQVAIPMYNNTFKPIVSLFSSIMHSPQRITDLDIKLDLIINELKPNTGSSIKDQLNRLEGEIALSTDQRKLILDSVPQGIATCNKKGECTWVNETLRQKAGAVLEEFLGYSWINSVHVQDRRMVEQEWQQCVALGRVMNLHYRMINIKTNEPFNVHTVAKPAKSLSGDILGWNATVYFL